MKLKARWGEGYSLVPRSPGDFGPVPPVAAHPAQPAAHPKRTKIEIKQER